jgi:hypothetical protein
MACTVYCLVPAPEDIEPLLSRLEDAGIPSRDIAVVRRGRAVAVTGGERTPAAVQWWSAPLAPSALWWAALYAWPVAVRDAAAEAGGHELIPLARYRAERSIAR